MKQINRRWWLTGAAVLIIIACVGILTWNTLRQAQPQLTAAQISDRVQEEYPGQITQIIQENGIYQVQLKSQQGTYLLTMDGRSGEMQTIKQIEAAASTATANSNSYNDASSSANADTNGNASTDTEPASNASSSASNQTGSSTTDGSNHSTSNSNDSNSSQSSETSSSSGSQQTNNTGQSNSSKPSSSKSPSAVSVTGAQAEQIARSQVKGEVDDVKYEHNSKNGQQYYLVEIDTPDDREAVVQINSITGAVMSVTWDDEDDEDDK